MHRGLAVIAIGIQLVTGLLVVLGQNVTFTTESPAGTTGSPGCGIDYCATCVHVPGLCTGCTPGYYQLPTGQCSACPAHCIACNGIACTECEDGWYLVVLTGGGVTCESCETRGATLCKRCGTPDHPNTICAECYEGYYISADYSTCSACPYASCSHCHMDDGGVICDSCADGHLLVESNCYPVCYPDCKTCALDLVTHAIVCTACAPGFYITQESGACAACPDNCIKCHRNGSNTTCDECAPGMYIDIKLNCSECDAGDHCSSCSRGLPVCKTCLSGYQLNDDPHNGCQYDNSYNCYTCETDCGVNAVTVGSNVTIDYCKGLNTTASCMTSQTWLTSSAKGINSTRSISRRYGCQSLVCTTLGIQECLYNITTKVLICTRCCGMTYCNREIPPGISDGQDEELDRLYAQLSPSGSKKTSGGRGMQGSLIHQATQIILSAVLVYYSTV